MDDDMTEMSGKLTKMNEMKTEKDWKKTKMIYD
jgi:hypothetical protein